MKEKLTNLMNQYHFTQHLMSNFKLTENATKTIVILLCDVHD